MKFISQQINKLKKTYPFLKELKSFGSFELLKNSNYAQVIVEACIPFQPGVYLVFSLDKTGNDRDLLYYGKAGVTANKGNPILNFHQLPSRLLAATSISGSYKFLHKNNKVDKHMNSKDITRARLWPWYVNNKYKDGIRVYWFITDWSIGQNPNYYENQIKKYTIIIDPNWEKSI